jgi:putative transcriptional regulator
MCCRIATLLAVVAWLTPATACSEEDVAAGKFLVATEEVRGEIFARTVILLLHYDETGAMGLVVNRPTEVTLGEILTDPKALSGYRDATLNWGGPVQMSSVRALLLADSPPDGAATIVDSIHLVSFDKAMAEGRLDPASLRLFIGYAGWAPGQLDGELAIRSWEVVPASAELVFADDPGGIWQSLAPVLEYRAAIDRRERLHKAHHPKAGRTVQNRTPVVSMRSTLDQD